MSLILIAAAKQRATRMVWVSLRQNEHFRVAVVGLMLCLLSLPAKAQDQAPPDARVYFESLAVVPTIRISDIGWDDNVFYESKADSPEGDFITTFSPGVQAWFRLPALLVRGRTQFDLVYYKELSPIRSVDNASDLHAELLLGRIVPFIDGAWEDRRYREYDELIIEGGGSPPPGGQTGGFEIEKPVRRQDSWFGGGVDVWISGKTSVGVVARRARADYRADQLYFGTDLNTLDAESTSEGVRARYRVTPFTTIGVDADKYRTTFPNGGDRDSEGEQLTAVVEFAPRATIDGSMRIGTHRRRFLDGSTPEFQGLVAHWGVGFTVLERTRLEFGLHRDLSYSYRADQRDYLEAGLDLAVRHRLATSWDVGGRVSRYKLSYGAASGGETTGVPPDEFVTRYRGEIGYYFGRTRLGFFVDHQTRDTDAEEFRGYEKTRICASVNYRF